MELSARYADCRARSRWNGLHGTPTAGRGLGEMGCTVRRLPARRCGLHGTPTAGRCGLHGTPTAGRCGLHGTPTAGRCGLHDRPTAERCGLHGTSTAMCGLGGVGCTVRDCRARKLGEAAMCSTIFDTEVKFVIGRKILKSDVGRPGSLAVMTLNRSSTPMETEQQQTIDLQCDLLFSKIQSHML